MTPGAASSASLAPLPPSISEAAEANVPMCVICESDPPTWALLPCGHKIFCETCIKLYMQEVHEKSRFEDKKCPKCRQPIATTQRIYD